MEDSSGILLLDLASKLERAQFGGKAQNLSTLTRRGISVPSGFAISVNAMKLFYEHNRIDIATQTATEFELLNASNSFPESLRTAISDRVAELTAGHPDQLFAIRSSAVDEDGEDNALAGLLESFLNVRADDVLQSVIKCWASSASQRAAAYRSFHGIDKAVQDPEGSLMGVVVQKMAAPIIAGVAFTQNPISHDSNQVVINFTEGLGDVVVGGHVLPKSLTIDKSSLLVVSESGHTSRPLESDVRADLVRVCGQIEEIFNAPQDIEWAFDGKQIWIVQARTITASQVSYLDSEKGQHIGYFKDILYNSQTIESMGFVQTPLNWTTFSEVMDTAFATRYRKLGIAYPTGKRSFYEMRWGHVYQNASLTAELMQQEFGLDPSDLLKEFSDMVRAAASYTPPEGSIGDKLFGSVRLLKVLGSAGSFSGEHAKTLASYRSTCAEMLRRSNENSSAVELRTSFEACLDTFKSFGELYVDISLRAQMFAEAIRSSLSSHDDKERITATMLVALSGVWTFEQSQSMNSLVAKLSAFVSTHPIETQTDKAAMWKAFKESLRDTPEEQALTQFLDEYGFRSFRELEVASPRWNEQPEFILDMLTHSSPVPDASVSTDHSAVERQDADLVTSRLAAEDEAAGHQNFFIRPLFRWAVERMQELTRLRENSKFVLVQMIAAARVLVLAIGQKLVDARVISRPERVFFMGLEDLRRAAKQLEHDHPIDAAALEILAVKIRKTIVTNKKMFERWEKMSAPPVFVGYQPFYPPQAPNSGDIAGHPASPGKAVGRALVVTTPEEAIHAIAGIADPTNLVLVTSTTDPAWTPIFMKVIGIVVEHGGLLSHGAITAREMGLPAVVGVGPNIKSITNGANIIVEGSTGKVVLPGQPIP